MRKIAKSELNSLFAAIAERAKLYVPQDTAGGAKFSERLSIPAVKRRILFCSASGRVT